MLEENACQHPDDVALIELTPSRDSRRQISWKQFNRQANSIANYLLQRGIQKDDK